MKTLRRILLILIICTTNLSASAVRIKDIAFLKGGRSNQLVGFSLVIGLNGTGDSVDSLLSRAPLINALERLGITVNTADIKGRSIAATIVTATLPPYAKPGQKIDISVSAIGDAISLKAGQLVITPLRASNSEIYAVAQGPITDILSGIELPDTLEFTGNRSLDLDAHQTYTPTVGKVIGGAYVEKSLDFDLNLRTQLVFNLREQDFTTAYRMSQAINSFFGLNIAKAEDAASVIVKIPQTYLSQTVELISKIENLEVLEDSIARVVVDEKSGIVVIGNNVVIEPVAISYKNLNLLIRDEGVFPKTAYTDKQLLDEINPPDEEDEQNQIFNQLDGQAVNQLLNNDKSILPLPVQEKNNMLVFSGGVSLKELVDGLNKLGVSNREIIDIIKNIKTAGAMRADLVFR